MIAQRRYRWFTSSVLCFYAKNSTEKCGEVGGANSSSLKVSLAWTGNVHNFMNKSVIYIPVSWPLKIHWGPWKSLKTDLNLIHSYERTQVNIIKPHVIYKALIISLTVNITEFFYGTVTKLLGCSQSPYFSVRSSRSLNVTRGHLGWTSNLPPPRYIWNQDGHPYVNSLRNSSFSESFKVVLNQR